MPIENTHTHELDAEISKVEKQYHDSHKRMLKLGAGSKERSVASTICNRLQKDLIELKRQKGLKP